MQTIKRLANVALFVGISIGYGMLVYLVVTPPR